MPPWSRRDKACVRLLARYGVPPHVIARIIGRSTLAVRRMAKKLKIALPTEAEARKRRQQKKEE